jgi:hypothetical protein
VITNSIRNVSDELVLWAFKRACLEQPTKRTLYYDALVKIGKRTGRNQVVCEVKRLNNEGKLIRKHDG